MDSDVLRKFIDSRSIETIDSVLLLMEKTEHKNGGTISLTKEQFDFMEAEENTVYNLHIKLSGKMAHHRSVAVRFVKSYK